MLVGDKFSSLELLYDTLRAFENDNFVVLWKRDSKTIASARKKGIKRHLDENLIYYR